MSLELLVITYRFECLIPRFFSNEDSRKGNYTMSYYVKKHRAVKVVFVWQKKFIQFTNEEMRRALETSKLIDDLFGEKCKKNMDTLK